MLQQQNSFLQQQLEEANLKIGSLLGEVSQLKEMLVRKHEEEKKQRSIARGLAKLQERKSERQKPAADEDARPKEQKPRENTNYGAKRKEHYELETEDIDVYPDDERYDEMKARLVKTRDVVRYVLVPMRFIKRVYHVHVYSQDGVIMEGKAPEAPLLGSSYDASFMAGMAQLRYIYSMPVERIVKLFNENGFDMDKGTAHGLLGKTEGILENLYKAMGIAVKQDDYLAGDETYHRVLVKDAGSKKGYLWAVVAMGSGLVYYFYDDGSRSQKVISNFLGAYSGTLQSDGFSAYRNLASQLTRLACLQHVKRKFRDCMDEPDAKEIYDLINILYQQEHKHKIGEGGWTIDDNTRWRQQYAPPILKKIRSMLDRMMTDKSMLPKSDKHTAVNYMLNEWEAIENIFARGDYHLDNNLVERMNRYISLSRKNSLFFGSHKGACRAAVFYSLACSCKLNKVNFFEYIKDVIGKLATMKPNTDIAIYREMLPDRWKSNNNA